MKINIMFAFDNNALVNALEKKYQINKSIHTFTFPELHNGNPTHPKLHLKFIKDIIDFTKNNDKEIIIITQSEHMMLYICKEVAEKRLNKDDIVISWIEGSDNIKEWQDLEYDVSKINYKEEIMRLDDEGEFVDRWKHGFFTERVDLFF